MKLALCAAGIALGLMAGLASAQPLGGVIPRFSGEYQEEWAAYVRVRLEQMGIVLPDDGGLVADEAPSSHATRPPRIPSVGQSPAPAGDNASQANPPESMASPIVYTRVPRSRGERDLTLGDGSTFRLLTPDLWDKLPDTRHVFDGFNGPGQLVLHYPDGRERILYNCVVPERPCVPLDPAVSPDGRRILFSVYFGESIEPASWRGATVPSRRLVKATEARLHVVDLDSGVVTPLAHVPGHFDVSPAWLPDGGILFASTRSATVRPFLDRIGTGGRPNPQLYRAEEDGSGAVNISPHEVATAMHPYVLSSGRVAYSSQWLSHNLAYGYNNGGINWPDTLDNQWLVMGMDRRGGDMHALLGAHRKHIKAENGWPKTMKALHFLGERENGDICVSNYYRGNNLGLGDVFCWTPEAPGIEGELPHFLPRNIYNIANWSKSNDEGSFRENGVFQGKIGYPEGLPGGQLMLTVGEGFCTQVSGSTDSFLTKALFEQPRLMACDVGIYRTTTIPSRRMTDLALVIDSPEWHEFGARLVQERTIATPQLNDTADGSCQLASSDAGTAQTGLQYPYDFNNNLRVSANNGGEIDGIPHGDLRGIRFWEVVPNTSRRPQQVNATGNVLRILGDVPLLPDDSFKVQLPCDAIYLMAGIDAEGRVIKRDQVPQSLRPGEIRVCTGCHLHSREGRPYNESLAASARPVPLLASRPVPGFKEDIRPLLESYCQSCHVGDLPLMDYRALVWDPFQERVPDSMRVIMSDSENERRRYGLQRPYLSKYVNSMFARESLLYWKAANRRADGREDSTYDDDIDFGPDHPWVLPKKDLERLALWLDSGAPE